MKTISMITSVRVGALLIGIAAMSSVSYAQDPVPAFHFNSICRSDLTANKNTVTVTLHDNDPFDTPLADVTINVLWSYVDYRQNRAVFQYKQASCITGNDGSCTFHGGSGRARWQLSEIVGYDLSSPVFDVTTSPQCPNSYMIDFW